MKTALEESGRNELLARIGRISTESRPTWGKMNAEQMLAHLTESLRMATGELVTKSKRLPIRYFPLKHLIIYVFPFPKGSPTAPELLPSDSRTIERSKDELTRLFGDLAKKTGPWPEHPAFGRLTTKMWGALTYKHFDHHLRQFGV